MDANGMALDSLPYIDREYDDPAMREQVSGLIQEEMGRVSPPAVPRGAAMFKTNDLLRKEFERVRSGHALPPFDVERYKLEAPSGEHEHNVDAWKLAADNAASQLEHQAIRIENLELLQNFGANAWKLGNHQKECLLKGIEAAAQRYRDEGAHLNKARKYEQTEAAVKLRDLEDRWSEDVRRCVEIQVAGSQLQQEIEALERQLADRQPQNASPMKERR